MNARRLDLLVTAALLILGVAGLVEASGFPDRAGQWPRAVLGMLTAFAAIHLAALLVAAIRDRRRDGER